MQYDRNKNRERERKLNKIVYSGSTEVYIHFVTRHQRTSIIKLHQRITKKGETIEGSHRNPQPRESNRSTEMQAKYRDETLKENEWVSK